MVKNFGTTVTENNIQTTLLLIELLFTHEDLSNLAGEVFISVYWLFTFTQLHLFNSFLMVLA